METAKVKEIESEKALIDRLQSIESDIADLEAERKEVRIKFANYHYKFQIGEVVNVKIYTSWPMMFAGATLAEAEFDLIPVKIMKMFVDATGKPIVETNMDNDRTGLKYMDLHSLAIMNNRSPEKAKEAQRSYYRYKLL